MNRFSKFTVTLALATAFVLPIGAQEAVPESSEFHDHVVIVLDASGSMKQRMRNTRIQKMDAAKSALKAVLKTVPPTTHIGLLVFSSKNVKNDWAYPLGPWNESEMLAAIDLPIPNRGTPLGEYIKIGADALLEARKAQYGYGTYRLLIVTDGNANDPKLVDRYTPEVLARGITTDVIGVDMDQDHTLATMAHSYRRANDPESLEKAVAEVFAELSGDDSNFSMDEAFDLIAPLPVESAPAALQALATTGNEPIGQKKRASTRTARSNPDGQSAAAPPQANPAPQTHRHVEHHTTSFLKIGIIGFIILLVIVKKIVS